LPTPEVPTITTLTLLGYLVMVLVIELVDFYIYNQIITVQIILITDPRMLLKTIRTSLGSCLDNQNEK
jgi:hypothetical protein